MQEINFKNVITHYVELKPTLNLLHVVQSIKETAKCLFLLL